jgi:hypothetical protein
VSEFHQGQHVDGDFFTFSLDRQLVKYAAGAEAGTVAHPGDRIAGDALNQFCARLRVAQIERHHVDGDGMLAAQFLRDAVEAFTPSCNEQQWIAPAGQAFGEFGADAGGGAGDDDGGL